MKLGKTIIGPFDWEDIDTDRLGGSDKPNLERVEESNKLRRWKNTIEFITGEYHSRQENEYFRHSHQGDLLFHLFPALKLTGHWTPAHDGGCPHWTWNNQFGSVQFNCAYALGFIPNERKLKSLWPNGNRGTYVISSFGSNGQMEYTSFIAEANIYDLPQEKILQEQEAHMTLFSQWVDEYRRFGDQPQWLMGVQREDDDPVFTPRERKSHREYKVRLARMIENVLEERANGRRWKFQNNNYV